MKKPMQSHTMELPRRIVVGGKNIDGIGKFLKSLKNTKEVSEKNRLKNFRKDYFLNRCFLVILW